MIRPHVFKGLWCQCGQGKHRQNHSYYVSVLDGTSMVLAAGPYQEHGEALAQVDRVNELVRTKYRGDPREPWYAYGTVAMPPNYPRIGKLNAELEIV